ncbi:Uma2 family endonuclease [Streptomyces sp. AJS327]|uniref:Uma2 family endonuclease n=1 Tax=Streptomyces sp. AJS327 TaxID=2545265 RepID=UPI0015DF8612|nr:Uma2 family endonuclease [Streptomyces sp. AJS327]MBA0054277.1 Uma2 family endonuclease [Streptomyces sp. AJS327]
MGGTLTAEPTHTTSPWPVPPLDGYTVDDLFQLPNLPPHTELIDGSLVFVSPQRFFHTLAMDLLVNGLRATIPEDLRVRREVAVVLDGKNAPEPDITVARAKAVVDRRQTRFDAADVVLAVEVVSPDSEARDRDTKPHKYARAGIPHFWLVEMAGEREIPLVRTYLLNPVSRAYDPTGTHTKHLTVDDPFHVDVDLTAIERL